MGISKLLSLARERLVRNYVVRHEAACWLTLAVSVGLVLGASQATAAPAAEATAGCRSEVTPPKGSRSPSPTSVSLATPSRGAYIGLYSIGPILADRRDFVSKTGHVPAIVFTFHDWVSDEDWNSSSPHLRTFADPMESTSISPLQLAEELRTQGGVLAVAWAIQCCDWDSTLFWYGFRKPTGTVTRLLAGDFDDYIVTVARQIRDYRHPIMLTLFSEFNYQGMMVFGKQGGERLEDTEQLCRLYGDPTWPDGPERIRDAFVHVIELFRREGARNVTWFMYAGSHYMNPHHEDYNPWLHPKFFYPGDEYIDWVGQSAYFIDPRIPPKLRQQELRTPITEALAPGYEAWRTVTQRPLFLPEFGILGDGSTSRARIIEEVFREVLPRFDRVHAITLAHFQIAQDVYEVPRLGVFRDEEIAWKRAVLENSQYLKQASFTGRE